MCIADLFAKDMARATAWALIGEGYPLWINQGEIMKAITKVLRMIAVVLSFGTLIDYIRGSSDC